MNEPRRVDVAYTDGHWWADITPGYEEPPDCDSLQKLIEAVQRDLPDQALLFIVDQATIDGYPAAEAQLLEANEKSGAMVISSVHET
jgi:hypothetical protein